MVERTNITIPEVVDMYKESVMTVAPNFGFGNNVGIGHAVVTEGGKTLRMSGYPAISTEGIVGKGDMVSFWTRRHVFSLSKKTCPLIEHEDMSS